MKYSKSLIVLVVVAAIALIGCTQKNSDEITVNLFNMDKANKLAREYLDKLSAGEIEEANKYLSEELISNNKMLDEGISEIVSYKPDYSIEGGSYGYFIYNVVRSSGVQPKSDLEEMVFKIKKINEEYKIEEIKSKSKKEVYTNGKSLRIIGEEGGKSSLIVSLNSLPKDTYLKDNQAMIYKDMVPKEFFGKVCLSFTGKRIAVTTRDEENSYVFLAHIDETLMTSAVPNIESSGNTGISELEDILEKPIAKKIISIDLLKEAEVTKLDFSEDEKYIQINFKNKFNTDRIRLYNTGDGSLIQTELDETFSEENYNVYDGTFGEDNFKFKASAIKRDEGSLDGEYILNLRTLDIKKL